MGWVAAAVAAGTAVYSAVSDKSSASKASRASRKASNVAADAQREALEYLKETEALPQEIREQALTGLSEYYQVPGAPQTQEELIAEAKSSPLYAAILGSREAGEEAILRTRSATGGLRSGGAIGELTDYNQQLENTALLESYNQVQSRSDYERSVNLSGLSGLAQLPSRTGEIANLTGNIGETRAQGIIAAAQARQQGTQNQTDNMMGIAQLGIQAYSAGLFSDIRLKNNIEYIGERAGHPWYQWDWSEGAGVLGLEGSSEGVMAHHVVKTHPEAIGERDGFLTVNYEILGLEEAA